MDLNAIGSHQTHRGHVTGSSGVGRRMMVRVVSALRGAHSHCLEEKRVAFSCKSSFCLSCCKVYIDQWVAHIGQTLYEGVSYRHVVLTMPDALHLEFYRDR